MLVQKKTGDTMRFEVESRLDDLFGETDSTDNTDNNDSIGNKEISAFNGSVNTKFSEPEAIDFYEEGDEMNEGHPLEGLKSTVLSIDWEITDEVMSKFVEQVEELKKQFKDNKIYLLFLQLLGSVGVYIKINRGKADPDAFKVLGSAFKAFDDVVSSEAMPNLEKKNKLSVELEKFKDLKKKIAEKKALAKPPLAGRPLPTPKQRTEEKKEKPIFDDQHVQLIVEAGRDDVAGNDDIKEIVLNPVDESKNINTQDIITEVITEMKKFIRGEFDDLRDELRLRKTRR